jgi:hypothetical protein
MRRVILVLVITVLISLPAMPVVAEDTADPRVEWHSPFESEPPDEEALSVDDGTIRLNASIYDESAIDYVEIERTYSDGQTDDRDYRQVDDLNNVSVNAGTFDDTEIRVRVFDEHGHVDVTEFAVNVDDNSAPTAEVETERTADEKIRLTGTVRDDTQPEKLTVVLPDYSNRVVNSRGANDGRQTLGGVDIARNSFEVDMTVPEPRGDSVTVRLEDRAGNQREIEVPLPSTETETPTPTATATPTPEPTATPVPAVETPAPTPAPTATPTATETVASTVTETPQPEQQAGLATVIFRFLMIGVVAFAIGGWISLQ